MKKATPILVTGYLCKFGNLLGYVGYVDKVWKPEQAPEGKTLSLKLLKPLPLSTHDLQKENDPDWGDFDSTSGLARPDQVRELTNPKELARVERFMAAEKAEEEKETPEEKASWRKLMAKCDRSASKRHKERERLDAIASKIGPKWTLPGKIERGDKSAFCSYSDPVIQEAADHVRRCAVKEKRDLTDNDKIRWSEGLALTNQASFWSARQECRDAVNEFDLDPFKDHFCHALYLPHSHTYAPNGTLREKLIEIWNRREEILDIHDMDGPNTCHTPIMGREPQGFSISHAKRRKLPKNP
jgi:hypothetical protein